jgi:hypothetical protein
MHIKLLIRRSNLNLDTQLHVRLGSLEALNQILKGHDQLGVWCKEILCN